MAKKIKNLAPGTTMGYELLSPDVQAELDKIEKEELREDSVLNRCISNITEESLLETRIKMEKEAWLDKACEHIKEYAPIDYDCDGFIEDFRKAMEEG